MSDELYWVVYDELIKYSPSSRAVLLKFGESDRWIPMSKIVDRDLKGKKILLPLWLINEEEIEEYIDD